MENSAWKSFKTLSKNKLGKAVPNYRNVSGREAGYDMFMIHETQDCLLLHKKEN